MLQTILFNINLSYFILLVQNYFRDINTSIHNK